MASQASAKYEDRKQDIVVKDFGGVNLLGDRTAIATNEFAWLENVIPLGPGDMKVLKTPVSGIALSSVSQMKYSVWGSPFAVVRPYFFYEMADGSLRQSDLSTGAASTAILAAATLSGAVGMAQWKTEALIVVDSTNYRVITISSAGSILTFQNGSVVSVTITNGGAGYVAVETLTFTGGGGAGAAASCRMQLNGAQAVGAGGAGYTVGDILTDSGGLGGAITSWQVRVETLGGGGAVATVSIYRVGLYSSLIGGASATTGGTGAGATITTLWNVGRIDMSNGGTTPYITAPTVVFTLGLGGVAATATILAGPAGGQTVATFAGRVWVGNGRTVSFSAPDSYTDFSTGTGGGSFVITSETLTKDINQMVPVNNFLYIFGTTSIYAISDVRVAAGPVTLFSNVPVSTQIGTPYARAETTYKDCPAITLGKKVLFANLDGIYSLLGSTVTKISEKIGPMFEAGDTVFRGAGVADLYGELCPVWSLPLGGPVTDLLLILVKNRWFFGRTALTNSTIAGAVVSSVYLTYVADTTTLYKLFSSSSVAQTSKIITALWPAEAPTKDKQMFKCGIEVSRLFNQIVSDDGTDRAIAIDAYLDNERGSLPTPLALSNSGQWINDAGITGQWVNSGGGAGDWLIPGFAIMQADAESKGRYVGYTLRSSSKPFAYKGILGQYEGRGVWNASGVS